MRTALGKPRKWRTIQLPDDLVKAVDKAISIEGLGYTSRSEFIKGAVREKLQGMKTTTK